MKIYYYLFLGLIIVFPEHLKAQNDKKKVEVQEGSANSPIEKREFYYFEIPTALNGSNIDPSPTSNITGSFSESKLSAKIGFPGFFTSGENSKNLKFTGFIEPSIKASSGVTTLYKTDNPPVEYGMKGGLSYRYKTKYWIYTKDYVKQHGMATQEKSSQLAQWFNLTGNIERSNYNLFDGNQPYGQMVNKENAVNGGLFFSWNNYFHSELNAKYFLRHIFSFGIGYAKTNNYSSLKKRTLETGNIIYNSDSTSYQSVTESTAGAIGTLTNYRGLALYAEYFFPLTKSKRRGSIYWGNRASWYGVGKNANIINGSTGFYISIKDGKPDADDNDKSSKDILNFSITGQFDQLNKSKIKGYMKDNFSVLLQASVPLRFN